LADDFGREVSFKGRTVKLDSQINDTAKQDASITARLSDPLSLRFVQNDRAVVRGVIQTF
jgi:hypothetical protein